jgi:Tfp pilus assembly protein PilF
MRIPKFALLIAIAEFITPIVCLGQSQAAETKTGRAATPVNDSVVSVEELKMSGKAESAFEKGTKLLQKGDARGSVAYFERALAKDPGYYRAYHNLGLAQYRLGEIAQAEEALQRAIDLTNGGFAPSEFALAMILVEKQQFREAERLIQRGLEMEPGSALGKYFLGLVQLALNHLSDAEGSARDALFRSADQADAHILLAKIHECEHNPYAVRADVAAYLKLDGHGPLENEANVLLQRAQKEISQKVDGSR